MLGLSGLSSDFRDLHKAAAEGNKRAQMALDVFNYEVKIYRCLCGCHGWSGLHCIYS